MSNFKSQAKRKRELAKLDKRQAKDQKRALRRAERSGTSAAAPVPVVAVIARPAAGRESQPHVAVTPAPLTLAEAAERWRNTRVVSPKRR